MRHLDWDGAMNARDLGGLRTRRGPLTVFRRLVRTDSLDNLTSKGWAQLEEHGVRTIIDLRDPTELYAVKTAPASITRMSVPLEDNTDLEFWRMWRRFSGTPLYYESFLHRQTARKLGNMSAVFSAMASATPGSIVFHCAAGRDRTGLISILLLTLAEVERDEIFGDFQESTRRLHGPLFEREKPYLEQIWSEQKGTPRTTIDALLDKLNTEEYLLNCGVTANEIAILRNKLLTEESLL